MGYIQNRIPLQRSPALLSLSGWLGLNVRLPKEYEIWHPTTLMMWGNKLNFPSLCNTNREQKSYEMAREREIENNPKSHTQHTRITWKPSDGGKNHGATPSNLHYNLMVGIQWFFSSSLEDIQGHQKSPTLEKLALKLFFSLSLSLNEKGCRR